MVLSLDGFPQDNLVPGMRQQAYFAQGESAAPAPSRSVCYVGKMLSSGTAQVNQPLEVNSVNDVSALCGAGSDLHRAVRKHFRINKNGKVYILPYADSAGTSADGYITFTGTATSSGLLTMLVAGNLVSVGVATGDTPTVLGAKAANALNGRDYLPCSAANDTGTVTLTAKHTGLSTGDGTTGVIRFRASVPSSTGVTVTVSGAALGLGDGTPGADGGTAEADLLDAALSVIEQQGYYYLVPTATSSAILANVKSHVDAKNTAGVGKRCVSIAGYTGTFSAARTLALAVNSELATLIAQPNSEHDTVELAAIGAAIRQKEEGAAAFFCANMTGYETPELMPVYSATDIPDNDDLNGALTDGVTPIGTANNKASLVKFVTTYSKTSSVNDQRAADVHRVSVVHSFMDIALARYVTQYRGFFLRDDKRLPDGTVDHAQQLTKNVLVPSLLKRMFLRIVDEYSDVLKNIEATKEGINVSISSQNTSRLEVEIDLDVVNLAAQCGVKYNETNRA